MGNVLDERDLQELGSPEVFQFRDVRAMAAKILRRATDVAQQKIDAATRHVSDLEKQAEKQGHEKGYAEGLAKGEAEGCAAGEKAARDEFLEKIKGLADVLAAIALGLDERKQELQARSEADLLKLSMSIARRIVRQELTVDAGQIRQAVQAAISLATSRQDVTICICPHEIAVIEEELPKLRQVFTDLGRVAVEARDNLQRGDVILITHEGEIDLRIDQQFTAIERALAGSPMPEAAASVQLRSHEEPVGTLSGQGPESAVKDQTSGQDTAAAGAQPHSSETEKDGSSPAGENVSTRKGAASVGGDSGNASDSAEGGASENADATGGENELVAGEDAEEGADPSERFRSSSTRRGGPIPIPARKKKNVNRPRRPGPGQAGK